MSKRDFLLNVRLAGNLLEHARVTTDSRHLDPAALASAITRAAIWLSPKAVEGFSEADFVELGPARQRALADAVRAFESVARQVPPAGPATENQVIQAEDALRRILNILASYVPAHEEEAEIRRALAAVEFPSWVRNWDFEPGSDEDGGPSVWVTLYTDESAVPPDLLGKRATEMIPKIRAALKSAGVRRWPYLRVRTAREYQTQP